MYVRTIKATLSIQYKRSFFNIFLYLLHIRQWCVRSNFSNRHFVQYRLPPLRFTVISGYTLRMLIVLLLLLLLLSLEEERRARLVRDSPAASTFNIAILRRPCSSSPTSSWWIWRWVCCCSSAFNNCTSSRSSSRDSRPFITYLYQTISVKWILWIYT